MKRFSTTWILGLCVSLSGAIAIGQAQGQQGAAQNPPAQKPPVTQGPQPVKPPAGPTHALHAKDPRVGLKPGLEDAGVAAQGLELVGHLPKPEAFQDPTGGLNFANSDLAFQGPH